jgi:hypothetical protein
MFEQIDCDLDVIYQLHQESRRTYRFLLSLREEGNSHAIYLIPNAPPGKEAEIVEDRLLLLARYLDYYNGLSSLPNQRKDIAERIRTAFCKMGWEATDLTMKELKVLVSAVEFFMPRKGQRNELRLGEAETQRSLGSAEAY